MSIEKSAKNCNEIKCSTKDEIGVQSVLLLLAEEKYLRRKNKPISRLRLTVKRNPTTEYKRQPLDVDPISLHIFVVYFD